jgi:hypothetical protein
MKRLTTCFAVFAMIAVVAPVHAQDGPLTVAEASGFTATSRHADVMGFVAELQRLSPLLRVESMGTSMEGRTIPLLIIGDPVPRSPFDLRYDDRAVVYIQANIHAGEVEGKEAAQMLARDLVLGRTTDYLDKLVILIAPIFNTDGNEKISTNNRRNQHGPEQGVGIRYNGQNLDLNRDGMKLETPEVQGLVDVLLRWDPVFFLDAHTHNGSYHQEPVTWTWGLNPNGDPAILDYMADVLLPWITSRMRDEYGILSIPHGDFLDVRNPDAGWVPLGPQPRYLSNYVALRNRISILNEQYPYVSFAERVNGAHSLFLSFLDFLHSNKDDVVALVRQADRRAIARGRDPTEEDVFFVEYGREAIENLLTIEGYEMEIVEPEGGGRPRLSVTDRKRTYSNVPYYARYTAERTVPFPRGYLITVQETEVIRKLLQHGIAVERLTEPATLEVEMFTVTQVQPSGRSNQGHYTSTVTGEYSTVEREFPEGTLFVGTDQALAAVAAYLLEPESDDGLVFWNFFDRHITSQWGRRALPLPVYKLHRPANLVTEAVGR